MLKGYLKRFAVLGIAFVHRYRADPFFRAEVNIGLLQMVKLVCILALLYAASRTVTGDIRLIVSDGMSRLEAGQGSVGDISEEIVDAIVAMRARVTLVLSAAIVFIAIGISYVIMGLALGPARRALQSQKEFIGNLAHEVRTPLSIIKASTEVALMAPDVSPAQKALMKSINEELDRTSEIINNLLSLSSSYRSESLQFGNIDLGDVVRQAVTPLKPLAEKKFLKIDVHTSKRRIVWGNATALEQIVMNVVKNAITHTPRNGKIALRIEPIHPNHVEFSVRDTGSGISREHLSRIFEPYYRGDLSRKRTAGNTGLGLTIVSELVKLHGGKVTVRSAEGRGTTVTMLFPAGREGRTNLDMEKRIHDNTSEVEIDHSRS